MQMNSVIWVLKGQAQTSLLQTMTSLLVTQARAHPTCPGGALRVLSLVPHIFSNRTPQVDRALREMWLIREQILFCPK